MKLNNNRLDAFYQVALDRNFSKAASNLCITQSALSQRVLKLEQEIKTSLFVRSVDGVVLTESGQLLFGYVRDIQEREIEALNNVTGRSSASNGIIRIATFSSILRSVVMPALKPLMRKSDDVFVEFFSRELRDLPPMLESGEVDFIIADDDVRTDNLISVSLGYETMVHIRSKDKVAIKSMTLPTCFLDHDAEDITTYQFFSEQGERDIDIRRSFYDDAYGLLDGVKLGFGEAIISKHLVQNDSSVEIVEHQNAVSSKVILYYQKDRFLSILQKQVIETLENNVSKYLK